jgi:hypothetical protein
MWREVRAIMDQYHPNLVVLNLHATDATGHEGSYPKYVRSITIADRVVYELWQKIQSHPFYSNCTTLIVTNDHGRHTNDFTNHGDCCEGCQHVMFLALGPHVRRGHRAGAVERDLHDIASTVGWMMGVPMPEAIDGVVMQELFVPGLDAPGVAASGLRRRDKRYREGPCSLALGSQEADMQGLEVSVVATDDEGMPKDVFVPGETMGLEVTVHNPGSSQVWVYQGEIEGEILGYLLGGGDTCRRGWEYVSHGHDPVSLAPGELFTDRSQIHLPLATPPGEWSVLAEARGLDEWGGVASGTTTATVNIVVP